MVLQAMWRRGEKFGEEADLSLGEWAVVEEIEVIRYIVRGSLKRKNW